ncbi:MAG: hypothetical protein OEZ40_10795 [Candidatus Bathyarchaeota archaeon]|nr:hypothetical protein [Candidatus Bathyarchaeota archaeon]
MAGTSTGSFSIFNGKEEYLIGETVDIYVKVDAIDQNQIITVTQVIVYDPADISVAEWHDLSIVLADTATPAYVGTIIAESEGNYAVSARATGFWDINGDGESDLKDIFEIIKAYGSYPEHPRWNPLADVNHDDFVDVRDIISAFGKWTLLAGGGFKCNHFNPNVIPEVPIGTIVATLSLLGAAGFYAIKNKKQP